MDQFSVGWPRKPGNRLGEGCGGAWRVVESGRGVVGGIDKQSPRVLVRGGLVMRPWLIWQMVDSAFPTGGFAHSGGIEAALQQGHIDPQRFGDHLRELLNQVAQTAIPFVTAAYDSPQDFEKLDTTCDAFLSNHVAKRASRQQGQTLLATATAIFSDAYLNSLRLQLREKQGPTHLPCVFGVVARRAGLKRSEAVEAFLFLAIRNFISAAVRLSIVGPMEAQRIQAASSPFLSTLAERSQHLTLEDIAQPAPLLDLLHANHDRLYSRLFHS